MYIVIGLVFLLLDGCSRSSNVSTGAIDSPKVILIIGDGMDDQQISIARNYLTGSSGHLAMDTMQYRGAVRVQSVLEEDPTAFAYVTGSAASAAAIANGIISSGLRISTFAQTDKDAVSIMELANSAGIGTGVVTTASVTDATPASFMAHVSNRQCQGPEDMARNNARNPRASYECTGDYKKNGGKGSIAEQIAAGTMDIVLGGGTKYFDQVAEGESEKRVLQLARANGYEVITRRSELQTIPRDKPILGLFVPGLMPPMLRGNGATLVQAADRVNGNTNLPEPYACQDNPEFADVPRVLEMTKAAISHLESRGSFMLVIENESIDEYVHARQPCGHIGAVAQIDETVRFVLQYAESHPELLVIVTADHGHAAQIISEQRVNSSPGHVARLITADESIMGINYATTRSDSRAGHSGVQVPIHASGPGVDQWPIFMPQTEIFHIARKHLGLEETLPEIIADEPKAP
jgi:alkaline phosphatase